MAFKPKDTYLNSSPQVIGIMEKARRNGEENLDLTDVEFINEEAAKQLYFYAEEGISIDKSFSVDKMMSKVERELKRD